MLSFLEKLLGASSRGEDSASGETATVRRIVSELEGLESEKARRIAGFAYLLSRVANADLDISSEETRAMEELVQKTGGLPEAQAVLVVEIAKAQSRLFGGTESFQVAREYRQVTDKAERERLLHCLFAVSAADEEISGNEEAEIRMISDELGFSHRELIAVRTQYNEYRSVVKRQQKRE